MPPTQGLPPGLMPFWMLNDASTLSEKIAFMRRCREGGIRALTLHPRAGNLIPFASREWFDMVRALVEEGARTGMQVWLYDEDPFPSGAAGGKVMAEHPDLRARCLKWKTAPEPLRAGDLWFIDRRRVLWAGLVPLRPGLASRNLTASVGPLRTDWATTEWDSRHYYSETPLFPCVRGIAVRMFQALRVPVVPPDYRLAAVVEHFPGTDSPWGSLPDLLQPETFESFAQIGLQPYVDAVGKHFGGTVPGIFTDEAKPHGGTPFTQDLFPAFQARFGYALPPRLHHLFGEPLGDDAIRTRIDYRRWILERFLDAFVRPYRAWCEARNLHLVGHFSPEDDPIQEAACLSACMPVMKAMGLPGCDLIVPAVGDESCPTLNLGSLRVGSLKSQTGRPYGISESQALGEWAITSRKTRQIYAWQKVLGIDRFFTHGFFSTHEGVTACEAPPDYGPNSSVFRGTRTVNAWLEACDTAMDGGREVAATAVLDNVFSFWQGSPGSEYPGMKAWRRSLWLTILHALQAHVGIHVLDAADAAAGVVTSAGLTVGERTYTSVLVPATDLMAMAAFQQLRQAAAAGVRVVWFGGGPARLAEDSGPLIAAPTPEGEVRSVREPSLAWCRTNLPAQARITGSRSKDCAVRRFRACAGTDRLLAVNLSPEPRTVTLLDEGGQAWIPGHLPVDGELRRIRRGQCQAQRWNVPGMGCGLFVLGKPPGTRLPPRKIRPVSQHVTFERLGPNLLRLDRCRISLKGRTSRWHAYPRPYWQCSGEYRATETFDSFAGVLPVESTVDESDLRYAFTFDCLADALRAELVLDPRCARGRFRVSINGGAASRLLEFPLFQTEPVRLPLRIRHGRNQVEFRFHVANAMEGLLSNPRIEGDFQVSHNMGRPRVLAGQPIRVSPAGWLEMGLAHYAGEGVYRWTETFSTRETERGAWLLELDEVVDSARLEINGVDQGTRAWPAWRWPLAGLKPGANQFFLTVSSTAGNAVSLRYPAQAQGWLGGGRLVNAR